MSKREDIALRVLEKLQNREASGEGAATRPRAMATFIGKVGEQMTQGFAARVEDLERERREGGVILALDPKRVRRSIQANRHDLSLSDADADFAALKQSLGRDGQIIPISVRTVEGDPAHDHEIVSGHRRHEAALQLDRERPEGFKIRAVLDSAAQDAVTLALHMYLENAARKDLSAYELGTMFSTWLREELFGQQQEIAQATGLGKPTISKYIQIATLPRPVLEAFGDPRVIAVRWAETLTGALRANEAAVLATAEKVAKRKVEDRPAPEIILRQLTEAAEAKKTKRSRTQSETVKINGRILFDYSLRNEKIAIRFGKHVDRTVARELTEEIKDLLTERLKARLGLQGDGQ